MTGGVAWDIEHFEIQPEFREREAVTVREPVRERGDAFARRAINRDGVNFKNISHPTHVIAVMVGAEDRYRREASFFQRRQHRRSIAGIDNGHMTRRCTADQPDIVVLEGAGV